MNLFNLFRKNKTDNENEKPSSDQLLFAQNALEILSPIIEKHGFNLNKNEIKKYSTEIVWRKNELYIKVSSTSYPTDYPYFYNLEFGEGSSDDFFEYDWNSIALWKFVNQLSQNKNAKEYKFPIGNEVIYSLKNANKELEKYANKFLKGDLELFYELRSEQNKNREPYKIYKPNIEGKYSKEYEPRSIEQKNKYS